MNRLSLLYSKLRLFQLILFCSFLTYGFLGASFSGRSQPSRVNETFVDYCERQEPNSPGKKSIKILQTQFRSTTCHQLAKSLNWRKELWVNGLGLENIEFVSRLPSLERIDLSDNIVRNISPLRHCENLSHLWLSDNEIESIEALSVLGKLKVLSLDSNRIVDITPLSACGKLQALNINNNLIQDLDALEKLDRLKFLFANRNRISSVWAISYDVLGASLRSSTKKSGGRISTNLDWGRRADKIGRPGEMFQIRQLSGNPLAKAPWEGGTVKDWINCPPDSDFENIRDYCRLDHL